MSVSNRRLWFVIPCFNEQEVLPSSIPQVLHVLHSLSQAGLCEQSTSGILLIDDGSSDQTWSLMQDLAAVSPGVRAIRLSRNRGHQTALLAGLLDVVSYADVSISLDADLQDDLAICHRMLNLANEGVDIVYGVRRSRNVDSTSKRFWAATFYRLAPRLGLESIEGHADFRLLSARALAAIAEYPERALYLRGMIPLLGFSSACVSYVRQARSQGKSKYPFRSSFALAIDGIISLSNFPLRLIAYVGVAVAAFSAFASLALVVRHMMGGTVSGWTSIMVAVVAATGLQMLALGVIGEYLARIYTEVKNRPRFHIQTRVGFP